MRAWQAYGRSRAAGAAGAGGSGERGFAHRCAAFARLAREEFRLELFGKHDGRQHHNQANLEAWGSGVGEGLKVRIMVEVVVEVVMVAGGKG
jgi:hypothetical protein